MWLIVGQLPIKAGEMFPSHSEILAEAINKTIFSFNTVVTLIVFIYKISRFKNPDVSKIAFSTMDLFYKRIVLYNRIIFYDRTIS